MGPCTVLAIAMLIEGGASLPERRASKTLSGLRQSSVRFCPRSGGGGGSVCLTTHSLYYLCLCTWVSCFFALFVSKTGYEKRALVQW